MAQKMILAKSKLLLMMPTSNSLMPFLSSASLGKKGASCEKLIPSEMKRMKEATMPIFSLRDKRVVISLTGNSDTSVRQKFMVILSN